MTRFSFSALAECDNCGAVETTSASIGSKCMFCKDGIMREVEQKNHAD